MQWASNGAYVESVNEGRIVCNVDKRLHPYIVDRWNGGHEEKVRQSYGMKGIECTVYMSIQDFFLPPEHEGREIEGMGI